MQQQNLIVNIASNVMNRWFTVKGPRKLPWSRHANKNDLGDGLYKLEASDQIPIVHSVHLYVIVFRNKYCLNQERFSSDATQFSV